MTSEIDESKLTWEQRNGHKPRHNLDCGVDCSKIADPELKTEFERTRVFQNRSKRSKIVRAFLDDLGVKKNQCPELKDDDLLEFQMKYIYDIILHNAYEQNAAGNVAIIARLSLNGMRRISIYDTQAWIQMLKRLKGYKIEDVQFKSYVKIGKTELTHIDSYVQLLQYLQTEGVVDLKRDRSKVFMYNACISIQHATKDL